MNIEEAIDRGFDPLEDYTPHPMTVEQYRAWCRSCGITPNPEYGIFDPNPPF